MHTWPGRLAALALAAAVLAAVTLASAGFGHRWGVWTYQSGFAIMRGVGRTGYAVAMLGLVALSAAVVRRRPGVALIALVSLAVAGAVVFVPWHFFRTARTVPPIHDITTDAADPPRFVALLSDRAGAVNSLQYAGAAAAALQARAYPDIGPATFPAPPARVFGAVETTARRLGWKIVADDPLQGRLEATDTTPWFGFTDDVVVRVKPDGTGTRVDVRSVSRVGRSDLGVNARRIRAFFARLRSTVQS